MTRVIGLDLSLAATGIAVIATVGGQVQVSTTTITSSGHRGDSLATRDARISRLTEAVLAAAKGDLAVIEGPSIMSRGGSNWDRAGLWWHVVCSLRLWMPVAVAAPTVVKKFAAGKGGADKASVAAGITRLWPDTEPGNDNEFDALALATIGAQRLDLPVPYRAHHIEALRKVEWPENLAAAIAAAAEDRRWIEAEVLAERTRDAAS